MEEKYLLELRRELHSNPEVSDEEKETSAKISREMSALDPDELIENIGGYGLAAVFKSGKPGSKVLFRAELDALPIPEKNDFEYRSLNIGTAHKCGHDGHMTILVGLARKIKRNIADLAGEAIILFQPAEETAQGAKRMLEDPKFERIRPDYVFALHNLPGFEKREIILRKGIFSSASRGMITYLRGETSHAAHPENSRTPSLAVSALIDGLVALPQLKTPFERAALITIIRARIGEVAFGTTPGEAEVMATLRAHRNEEMDILTEESRKLVEKIRAAYDLDFDIESVEIFPASENEDSCVDLVSESANKLNLKIFEPEHPFPWSEDFSYFLGKYPGALFGLGSGKNSPQLHNSTYDFPDDITLTGIDIFYEIFKKAGELK